MIEIAISSSSRSLVASTPYDVAAGYRFDNRQRAEQFCRELNHFCYQERFLVVRVSVGADPLPLPPQRVAPEAQAQAA